MVNCLPENLEYNLSSGYLSEQRRKWMSTFRGMSDAKHSKPTGGVFFSSEDGII